MATVKLFNHHIRTPFLFLLLSEYALLFISVYVGLFLRYDAIAWQPLGESLVNLPLKALIYSTSMILGMIALGQYQAPGSQGRHYFPFILLKTSLSLTFGGLGLLVIYYAFPEFWIGRGIFGYAVVSAVVFISLYRTMLYRMIDGRSLRKKVLVLGAGELAFALMQEEIEHGKKAKQVASLMPSYASYAIHGFVDTGDEDIKVPDMYIVRPGERLVAYCLEHDIDEIVLAISDRRKKVPVDDLLDCKLTNIRITEYVAFWEKEKGLLRTDMLNPSWLIFCDGCQQGDFERMLCRGFDVFISLVILIVMFPVLVLTAIIIFIENNFSGPIFYRQERVGFNGINFQLLKFRSMRVNAEIDGKAKWADKNDSRVTVIGRIIRKVRIDELPQILNILKGDMSIVGPRPERPEFVEILSKKMPFYSTRHRVKPGLAGWAQLKYPYGADEHDAMRKLQFDLYYVKNHSILMDILVLLQTIEVIVMGKGAR